jgi:hypothetical protein
VETKFFGGYEMKKLLSLALAIVLTASVFTGCGCTNSNKDSMTTPTAMPTTVPTMPSTAPATMPTTRPTVPTTEETTATGNGPLEDETTSATDATESTSVAEGRARRAVPYSK